SFFGLEYSTNNLLGYGESLSIGVSGGNRSKSVSFGFTEPYLMGKPISLGFNLFASQYQFVGGGFDYASQEQQLIQQFYGAGVFNADELFTQRTVGGSVSLGGPLQLFTRKFEKFARFTRLQMSYSLTGTTVKDPAINTDDRLDNDVPVTFSQPRIITSRIFPSIYYNTKNASLDPTMGKSLFMGVSLAGGVLGGDVRTVQPTLEFQYFKPVLRRRTEKPHVLAMRFKADHIRAYGALPPTTVGDTRSLSFVGGIPIFERFFLGGDQDIRGYNLRSLGPIVRGDTYGSTRNVTAMIADPSDSTKLIPYDGNGAQNLIRQFTFDAPMGNCAGVPVSDLADGGNCNVSPGLYPYPSLFGGDTQVVYNIEYRIPIISVLTVAAFADVGTAFNARKYDDQITSSNFVGNQPLGTVIVDPNGAIVTGDALAGVPVDDAGNPKDGFNRVFMLGDSQRFDIVRASASNKWRLKEDLRSSLGLEFRVQMPVINVPFRLIMAYNPYADNPTNIYVQKKTVLRFSVGRTF
ncbi:MAG TPA: BamA/TamA family outer membrane protein, partial [Blastocatellia bacterium]